MKKILFIFIMLVPNLVFSQKSQLNQFFDKYSGQDGYTSVYITKYLFEMFAKLNTDKEEHDFKDATNKLESIKILTVDSALNSNLKINFSNELKKILPRNEYKDLMVVREGKKQINFMIRETNGKISELVMTVIGENQPLLIMLEGDIDLAKISKISKSMKIDGFENLEKVDDKK
jgi:hypothetical protein